MMERELLHGEAESMSGPVRGAHWVSDSLDQSDLQQLNAAVDRLVTVAEAMHGSAAAYEIRHRETVEQLERLTQIATWLVGSVIATAIGVIASAVSVVIQTILRG